jgi:predicted RNA binding protein YcfA (HicA-like mRNA interferase family)
LRKLTELPTARVPKALSRAGWEVSGGAKHYKLVNPAKPGVMTVPRHRLLRKWLVRKIISQAGLSVDEFFELYR